MTNPVTAAPTTLTPESLLAHWEGHRGLTRRTIDAFPADQLFSFTPAPPMRSFGAMMLEVLGMMEPVMNGLRHRDWQLALKDLSQVRDKPALLSAWDEVSASLPDQWAGLPAGRLQELESAYGWTDRPAVQFVLYAIDNEIHHRAQGYVYLRLLGIEPPAFYER